LALEVLEARRLLAAAALDTEAILQASPLLGQALSQWTGALDPSAQRAQNAASEDRDDDGDVDSSDLTTIVADTSQEASPAVPQAAAAADAVFAPADPEVTAYWLAGLDFYVGRKNFGPRYP
jgi:hypothetical protein